MAGRKFNRVYLVCFLLITVHRSASHLSNDPEKLLNWCLNSTNHKSAPGPEDDLHKQCFPWKDRACCTTNTTRNMHVTNVYKFNYNHCGSIKNMSESCRRHFMQDECFYECSPNIGPWVVQVSMKVRNERFFEVPLCASDCDAWFNACKDDFTCNDKWIVNTVQDGQLTPCHHHSECKTFTEIYRTPQNFCEKVWDHSWKYTNDTEPCMRIWFDGKEGNPNDKVARYFVEKVLFSNRAIPLSGYFPLVTIGIIHLATF